MPRLVLAEARRDAVDLAVGAQERLGVLAERVLGRQRRRYQRVLPDVEPRVDVGVIEDVVLPYGQHLTVAGLLDQEVVQLDAKAGPVEHHRALLETGHAVVLED